MRKYQNALLAGVAAVALVVGTGFASAQEQPKDQSTAPKAGAMHAVQPTQHSDTSAQSRESQGKTGMSAQNAHQGAQPNATGVKPSPQQNASQNATNGKPVGQTANKKSEKQPSLARKTGPENGKQKQTANAKERNNRHMARSERMIHGRRTAQRGHEMRGRQTTAQRNREFHGLQANASGQMKQVRTSNGTNVRLSDQQRTRIRETIIDSRNAPRVGQVDFSVNIGTVIPRPEFTRIHVVPVPRSLVRIEPRWRGLEYFIFTDEVVIVNPHDLRIVAIIPA